MKKWRSLSILGLSVALLLAACGGGGGSSTGENASNPEPAQQETGEQGKPKVVDTLNVTLAGGAAGGFWSLIGEGVGSILRQEIPNTQFSYETGNGVKNVLSVSSGQVPMGIAYNFEVKAGLNGDEPFKEKVPQVTALVNLYNNSPVQMIISKSFADKYGINSMEDIAAKKPPIRIAVNQRGNMVARMNQLIFESYGVTFEDIESWGGKVYYEPYKSAAEMMKDGKVDWISNNVFAPDSTFLELSNALDIKLLSLNENAQKTLQEKLGLVPSVIKAGTYQFQEEDVPSANGGAMIMVDPNMSVDEAYTITKTLVENIDLIRTLHKNLTDLTPEIMADAAPAKLHPGAEMYFKEAGILQ